MRILSLFFFLSVLLCDEMDFVFDGPAEPRALCVLPATEEGRSAGARTRHPRDPRDPGQPSRFQRRFPQEAVETNTLCRLEIKEYKVT